MFIDFSKKLQNNVCKNLIQPRRAQIYVGFQCHQRCGFCYYKHRCNEQMFSLDFIKKQIDFEFNYGIVDIEITGGEPSECKWLREVCQYIKTKSPKSKIAIITNGGLFQSNVWDLIDEVLVSYHISKNDPCINKQFFPLGDTYEKTSKTIQIAKENCVLVRTNTILASFNISGIKYIIDDLINFKPNMINFLPINIFDQATEMMNQINYDVLRPTLKHAIDELKRALPSAFIYARYMPFCQMEGYEQHIVGNLQHIYDWFDWNREIDGPDFLEYIRTNTEEKALKDFGVYGSTSIKNVVELQNDIYYKNNKCLKCKYLMICDGVEDIHKDHQLKKYIYPSKGKIIDDFMFFMKDSTYQFYKKWYGKDF